MFETVQAYQLSSFLLAIHHIAVAAEDDTTESATIVVLSVKCVRIKISAINTKMNTDNP